ncbi:MAG: histidine phosphatase family protein, partial [Pseudomonadota bacterium]
GVDSRIMEYHFGDWEMLSWQEIKGERAERWFDNFVDEQSPNGENMRSMQARVMEFYEELLQLDADSIAVFTHAGVQRIIHAHILSTPLKDMFRLQLDYGNVIESKHHAQSGSVTVRHL